MENKKTDIKANECRPSELLYLEVPVSTMVVDNCQPKIDLTI